MEDQPIIIYETGGKNVKFKLDPDADTLWATQAQIASLFDVNTQTVNKHLRHIYQDGELEENRTCKKSSQITTEGNRTIRRTVKTYNLDTIISIAYRVNSRKATDFRIWATNILRKYITTGLALNEPRLAELSQQKLLEANDALDIVRRLIAQNNLTSSDTDSTVALITRYADTFRTLGEYDAGFVRLSDKTKPHTALDAGACISIIDQLRTSLGAGEMFGRLRGDSFEAILRTIDQSFAGQDLYTTLPEKAANLLYLIIKDHPFFDGNKRIAALLFINYLTINRYGLLKNGDLKIPPRALVALTLMIAESNPREKGLMTAIVCRLLEE